MNEPKAATMERIRDYAEWHVQNGRGKSPACIDQRGLSFLEPKHYSNIRLALPLDGDGAHADGRCFLRAVF